MKAKLTVLSSCVVMFCGHARIMSRRGECLVENCCVMRERGVLYFCHVTYYIFARVRVRC